MRRPLRPDEQPPAPPPEPERLLILRRTLDAWWCPFCGRANGTDRCSCGAIRQGDAAAKPA